MRQVFASYSRLDDVAVRTVVRDLERLSCAVWLDQQLSGGEQWWLEILRRIRACDIFLFAISEHSLKSKACRVEYDYATALGKPVLPVLLGSTVSTNMLPAYLALVQVLEFKPQSFEWAMSLGRALRNLPECPALPDVLPAEPPAPISYLVNLRDSVDASGDMDYEQQLGLLMQIRAALRDPEAEEDAQVLLRRFRARRDLRADVAKEADETMLQWSRQLPSTNPGARVQRSYRVLAYAAAGVLAVAASSSLPWRGSREKAPPSSPAGSPLKEADLPAVSTPAPLASELSPPMAPPPVVVPAKEEAPAARAVPRAPATPLGRLQGTWRVEWTDLDNSYQGTMKVRGSSGTLRITCLTPITGEQQTLVEALSFEERTGELVMQAREPRLASDGQQVAAYEPDHAHIQLSDGSSQPDVRFCDSSAPTHKCFRGRMVRVGTNK